MRRRVLTTISDKKIAVASDTNSSLIGYFNPDIVSAQDYYPFGMPMRVQPAASGRNYRFGFNGKEQDHDVKGWGNQQDYGMRIYDNRLGRFLSVDPLKRQYPQLTPYQFSSNRPIEGVDVDGLEFMRYFIPSHTSWLGINLAMMGNAMAKSKYNEAHGVPDGGWVYNYQQQTKLVGYTSLAAGASLFGATYAYSNFWAILPQLVYNPVVHTEIIGGLAVLAGYNGPDIPSPGTTVSASFRRTWEEYAITTTQGGREILKQELKATAVLVMETGSSFANEGEKRVVQKLLSEGNEVLVKAELTSSINGAKSGYNGDIVVNGIKSEIKELSAVKDVSKAIKDRLGKASKQAQVVYIDLTQQEGATLENARNGVIRYFNQSQGNLKEVRVMGKDFDEVIKNKNYKGN